MNHSDYSSTCMMMAQQQQPAARQISQPSEAAKKHSHGTVGWWNASPLLI